MVPAETPRKRGRPPKQTERIAELQQATGALPGDLDQRHRSDLMLRAARSPWFLRLTEQAGKPSPVIQVKQHQELDHPPGTDPDYRVVLGGLISGDQLRVCLGVFRVIIARVSTIDGVPLGLERYLQGEGLRLRGNLPLDDEAGVKMALICRLQERVAELDRVELMARRVSRFTREEAAYWYSRATNFGVDANRWALAGMRIMLGGQPADPAVAKHLRRLAVEGP
jgi:hypothetical protein